MLHLALAGCMLNGYEQLKVHTSGPSDAQLFQQKLDRIAIDSQIGKYFNQRYYVNEEFVVDPENVKVAILSIGGESDTDSGDGGNKTSYDIMGEVALRYNAPIYTLEHRFYGKSQPFAEDSNPLSTEHLKYLSSRYEIQDLVAFQAYID